jgi:DNA helicase-2/ATP-dependent DNA helicase PcrA
MPKSYLEELNDAQRAAVLHTDGPALVIAGAGSGKTRVLTYRIARLLESGVPAHSILALTFTNKAAAEMKERIGLLVGEKEAKALWMGTFHSIFARILRKEGSRMGYSSNFTIYDSADSKSMIRGIIKELQLDDETYKPNDVASRISSAKNNLVTPNAYFENSEITRQDAANNKPRIADIYRLYAGRCKKADAMDFDDLLLNTNILFRDSKEALEHYQKRFKYILVDEYQDTNYSQYLIVQRLAAHHKNVCVVGDDAQSIYSFRGARIENILNFRNDYPGYKLFKLEQNYRSTQTIVNAANSIISKNKGQIQKSVWSAQEEGDKIRIYKALTDQEEGFLVAADIHSLRFAHQAVWSGIAILYRTNAQSRIFEESLRKKNIPYKIYGGLSFYQRKEIKDLLAYYRLIVNPNDQEAFLRVVNYPGRGIGDTTLEKLQNHANGCGLSLWQVVLSEELLLLDINKGLQAKLRGFAALILGFQKMLADTDAWELAMHVAEQSGIFTDLKKDKTPEGISRSENIQELLNSIKEYSDAAEDEETPTLEGFLQNVALLTDQDSEKSEDREKVTLMTVHAAKGLEFDYVYVVGMEDELFPSQRAAVSVHELEEERRLFYVALTRARKQAVLSWSQTRYRWGTLVSGTASRFIREIDNKYLENPAGEEVENHPEEYVPRGRNLFTPARKATPPGNAVPPPPQPQRRLVNIKAVPSRQAPTGPVPAVDPSSFRVGCVVEHEKFGRGTIAALEGDFPNTKATVDFEQGGRKQLLLKFARLNIISG